MSLVQVFVRPQKVVLSLGQGFVCPQKVVLGLGQGFLRPQKVILSLGQGFVCAQWMLEVFDRVLHFDINPSTLFAVIIVKPITFI